MSIRRALNSLPSKPGIILAVIVSITVLSVFYYQQYRSCSEIASLRSELYEGVKQHVGKVVHLVDITPFTWGKVRMIINHQNKGKVLDCPFEWDWTQKQRKQLMANGQLNVMAFARKDVNTVVDFKKEMIDFVVKETILKPDTALFKVEKHGANDHGYILRQITDIER